MNATVRDIVRQEVAAGTGADIGVAIEAGGRRPTLRVWFADLSVNGGPVVEVIPHGLRGYQVCLGFGTFARQVIGTIKNASEEKLSVARALMSSISPDVVLDFGGQQQTSWQVTSSSFRVTATMRRPTKSPEDALTQLSRDVLVPMMSAIAELIGYDLLEEDALGLPAVEGAVHEAVVLRRERSPRNRLLCLRLHGERCLCCSLTPGRVYGNAGGIIEVHHLEPLAILSEPRPYNPATDLVPLCPNCHRAVHSRRPIPLSLDELRDLMNRSAEQEST